MENEENKSADISLGNQSVGRLLFRYAFPSALSLVCNAIYNIVDQVFNWKKIFPADAVRDPGPGNG
ncbi:MAG: hypothetical protein LUC17_01490 [Oscillospiraceae bacterium]|nr:hypothetical protein [Oscillospiraceae bacterium]